MSTPAAPPPSSVRTGRPRGDARSPDTTNPPAPPARWALLLRPLGYAGLALVSAALALAILFVLALLPAMLEGTGPLADAPGVTNLREEPSELLALAVVVPLMALIFGYVGVLLLGAVVVLGVLALTYVVRALQPGYAGERLSATGWTRDGIGPVTAYPSAMSLIPRRLTPWTRFWLRCYLFTFTPSGGAVVGTAPAGAAYLVAVVCVLWPITDPLGTVAWLAVCSALLGWTAVLLRRAWLRREAPAADPE